MAVPEAAIYENCDSVLRQDNVRIARKTLCMKAKSKAASKEQLSQNDFWPSILCPNSAHIFTAVAGTVNIGHALSG